ncbi:hypothetical protein FXO38_01671 [Capsicum annuum]|nr:hypothetical protein FXO38_01671 [Capsicum annuum]
MSIPPKSTPPPRAAKVVKVKTPFFKPIPTRQITASKSQNVKQTARVFPPVQSKSKSLVKEKDVTSKKVFEAFRDQEQCADKEPKEENIDHGGLETSGQHYSSDVVQNSDNMFDGTNIKEQYADKESEQSNINDGGLETSEQYFSSDTRDEKIDETILSDSQFTISDELLPSLNTYQRKITIVHSSANCQEETPDKNLNDKHFETVVEDHCRKIDVCFYYLQKKSKYEPHSSYKYITVDCNFMNIIRSVIEVYSVDDPNLNAGG